MPQIQGKIKYIDPIKPANEKFNSESIDFALESETEINGQVYTNAIVAQMTGNKVHMLDDINIGDEVDCTFGVRATIKPKEGKPASEKNPASLNGFSNVTATNIKLIKKAEKTKAQSWNEQQRADNSGNPSAIQSNNVAATTDDDLPF